MPADLPEIRALLASLVGFTPGPWRIARTASRGGLDPCKVYTDALGEHPVCIGGVNGFRYSLADQRLFASAPDLHRHASELADEVERLRAEVEALRAGQDEAVAAERHRIGAWIRAQKEVNVVDRLSLSRAIEHGDHIDDDAPPLPSLRSLMLLRDELLRQVAALTAEVKP